MKIILPALLALLTLQLQAQFSCNSWSDFDRVINFKSGTPYNITFDGGIQWEQLGAFVGVRTFVQYATLKGLKQETDAPIFPYFKVNTAIFNHENFQLFAEASVGKQYRSVDFKFAYLLCDDLSVIVVPAYSNQTKEIDVGVEVRL
jgi:hypothetical protein